MRILLYLDTKGGFVAFLKLQIVDGNVFVYQFFIKKYTIRSDGYIGENTVFCAFGIPPAGREFSVSISVISKGNKRANFDSVY